MTYEEWEKRQVLKTECVLVKRIMNCDVCGKEINGNFFKVKTGHNDWGNDSVDSIENHDICSVECLVEKTKEFYEIERPNSNTAYMKVERDKFKSYD